MEESELIQLVKETSLQLMNENRGDGTIAMCYEDDEIIATFGGLTKSQVIRKVAKMDRETKEYYDFMSQGWG